MNNLTLLFIKVRSNNCCVHDRGDIFLSPSEIVFFVLLPSVLYVLFSTPMPSFKLDLIYVLSLLVNLPSLSLQTCVHSVITYYFQFKLNSQFCKINLTAFCNHCTGLYLRHNLITRLPTYVRGNIKVFRYYFWSCTV